MEAHVAQPARRRSKRGSTPSGPGLARAPEHLQCCFLIDASRGRKTRCSRYTLPLADGSREDYCIGHSDSEHARALRARGSKAESAQSRAETERRHSLAKKIFSRVWKRRSDFVRARFRICQAVASGELTPTAANTIRGLLRDAEEALEKHNQEWGDSNRIAYLEG